MTSTLNDALISAWVTGWARCRGYRVRHDDGMHATLRQRDTGDGATDTAGPGSDWEYVVAEPTDEQLQTLGATIAENPQRLLTIVASAERRPGDPDPDTAARAAAITGLRAVATGERLMTTDMAEHDVETPVIPDEFEAKVDRNEGWFLVTFTTTEEHSQGAGQVAARGRVAVVDDYAVFDQIWTYPAFRRQGLGSLTMRYLSALALEHEVDEGLLVASADGQALYGYLGWDALADVVVMGTGSDTSGESSSHNTEN